MTQGILNLKNITVQRFQHTILDAIDLSINDGDFVMLIGPNGSGKTTLMKLINGTVKPNCGDIILDGHTLNTAAVHSIARSIATLTQDIHQSTFGELTVEMNLTLALERTSHLGSESARREYLANFSSSLNDRYQVCANKLSGGQRQALALAMCFVQQPRMLLLDEHTAALDPKAAHYLMELTHQHVEKNRLTTLMISHNLEHVLRYGNRLIVLNEGRIVADLDQQAKNKLSIADLVAFAY